MADTLTTFLSLVKQTIGGNRNTWGNILNANMDLLDSGIAGRHAVSTTGGSTTLSDTQWIKRIIDVTGVLVSNATIVLPNQSGFWLVRNGTTGAYTLSCKTASGAAITVTQGGWQLVWCDGSDVMRKAGSSYFFDTQMQLPDGTISAPGMAFLSETTLGARRAGYASGTLANNPFATTNTSPTVTVTHTAHGLTTADYANFSGASAVAGITIDGLYAVTVVNANSYTITHSANANATTSGGGASVAYKYMEAAATAGGAITLVKGSADIAHISPYGIILTGAIHVTGALRVAGAALLNGAVTIGGALSAAAATFSGLITGATATLTGLLTLSSTSHMILPTGTTGERPGSPAAAHFRFNSSLDIIEWYSTTFAGWKQPQLAPPVPASRKNLVIKVASNTTVTVTADFVTVTNGTLSQTVAVSSTVNLGTATAVDALDTGVIAIDKEYHLWVISKTDGTTKVIGSLQSSANVTFLANLAAIASGAYTYYARVGAVMTVHATATLYGTWQIDRIASYIVGLAQTTLPPVMESGVKGTYSTTSPAASAVVVAGNGKFVPSTASRIFVAAKNKYQNGTTSKIIVGPNASWFTTNTGQLGSLGFVWPIAIDDTASIDMSAWLLLESTSIYWASSATGGAISCLGWEDNI